MPAPYQFFAYSELQRATDNFAAELMIGEGGFGRVYKGRLRSQMHVAVKRLDRRGQQVISEDVV